MIVVRDRPPMYDQIVKVFPDAKAHGVVFAWGNRIYNPSKVTLSREILAHEEIHHQQQGEQEEMIVHWWSHYLADPGFRFRMEVDAHIAEYKAWRPSRNGFSRKGYLHKVASALSSPLYGSMVTYEEAVRLICQTS